MPIGRKIENDVNESISEKCASKSNANKIDFRINSCTPLYSFSDMILEEEVREQLEDVMSIYKYNDLIFADWNLKKVIKRQKGIFVNLYGLPGTGKTMAANAIAHELGRNLIWVNYAEIESKYVGETSKNLVKLFEYASLQDVIILFDEADALLSKRVTDMSSATDVSVNQTRSVLLHLLDEYEGMIIFTTNFIQNYDPAFMRRIPYHIKFGYPNEKARIALLKHYLSDTIPNSVDIENIAKKYVEITGNDISTALLTGALSVARNGERSMSNEVFSTALKRVVEGKKINKGTTNQVKVYEREVSEEYALQQIRKTNY